MLWFIPEYWKALPIQVPVAVLHASVRQELGGLHEFSHWLTCQGTPCLGSLDGDALDKSLL